MRSRSGNLYLVTTRGTIQKAPKPPYAGPALDWMSIEDISNEKLDEWLDLARTVHRQLDEFGKALDSHLAIQTQQRLPHH
jgi:hypothetical protein